MAGQFEDFAFGFTSNKICKLTDLNVTSNRINNKGGIIHSLAIDTNVKSRQVNVASNDMEYNTITSKSRSFEPTRFVRKEHVAEEGWDRGEREAEFRVTPTGSGSAGQKSILTLGVIGPLEEKRGDTDRAFWLGQAKTITSQFEFPCPFHTSFIQLSLIAVSIEFQTCGDLHNSNFAYLLTLDDVPLN
ncbi:hypothetical protein BLNAU_24956 [Blattamonas nauphoetae]|uniref:Uncharacterized protein n=1 Tax=Blattamonas nauphoetae TaxID=2049346 RepID=A0ABQ9WKY2_9EUKA|nr:hypothetical protein BLNAU_24956 [Blattamonas nauphoetae]